MCWGHSFNFGGFIVSFNIWWIFYNSMYFIIHFSSSRGKNQKHVDMVIGIALKLWLHLEIIDGFVIQEHGMVSIHQCLHFCVSFFLPGVYKVSYIGLAPMSFPYLGTIYIFLSSI